MINLAGRPIVEATLTARDELNAAGVPLTIVDPGRGEVQSMAGGELHGWTFDRRWYYWAAHTTTNPVPADIATRAWTSAGDARINGHCGNPAVAGPVYSYHIDSAIGLALVVRAIREAHERAGGCS